jgi:hypothetical protein
MKKLIGAALLALASAASAGTGWLNGSLLAGDGSQASPYDFGTLGTSPSTLLVTTFGSGSFEEYANFYIDDWSNVSGVANTYELKFYGFTLMDIDNLTIEVWDNTHPGSNTLYSTFAGDNATQLIGTLAPGQYHLDISGTLPQGVQGGQYSVALASAPVPEPQTYALVLAGLGVVALMARRRRPQD